VKQAGEFDGMVRSMNVPSLRRRARVHRFSSPFRRIASLAAFHAMERIECLESRVAPAALANLDLSSLDGKNGVQFNGVAAADLAGFSVGSAGDFDGDGVDDFVVGAWGSDPNGHAESGTAYLVFGNTTPGDLEFDLSTLDGADGFKIQGDAADDRAGFSVAPAGDVNHDGKDDLIIGAYGADPNGVLNAGASYVLFGKARQYYGGTVNVSSLDGSTGFKIFGEAANDFSGLSVGGAGDVNGDGFDDVIIGANGADPNGDVVAGASYIVFGRPGHFPSQVNLSELDGSNGFKISGAAAGDLSGFAVAAAGDMNGDGFDDIIIGAHGASINGAASGAAYIVFGKERFPAEMNLSVLSGLNGFRLEGGAADDHAGFAVSGAGDLNGDGFDDVLVGAYGAHGDKVGSTYVIYGRQGGFAATLNLLSLNAATTGFEVFGSADQDLSGSAVRAAGDVNHDGYDDLVIGAPWADPHGDLSGASYVVFGRSHFIANQISLGALSGESGFKISGEAAGDGAGTAVSGIGDFNGDGFDDLVIGAPGADPHGLSSGAAYLVYGFNSGASVSPTLNAAKNKATFTDVDGDLVTVKVSKGQLDPADFTILQASGAVGVQLVKLDFSDDGAEFQAANLTITAKRTSLGGDGIVNVGFVNAEGVDLGKVTISGDLGRVLAGDANEQTTGIASLSVGSLGRLDTQTQDSLGNTFSFLKGPVGPISVKTDIDGAAIIAASSGQKMASLTVGGDLRSESKLRPGAVFSGGSIGQVKIGGSLVGGEFAYSGSIVAQDGNIDSVKIAGDLVTGGDTFSGTVFGGRVGSLSIGGSVIATESTRAYFLFGQTVGKLKVAGDLRGSETAHLNLSLVGVSNPANDAEALAVKSISIGGDVINTSIFVGSGMLANPDVHVGAVNIGGDWIASNLSAGVDAGPDNLFGTLDDAVAPIGSPTIYARIASITVGGQIRGTLGGADHFGFVSQQIGSFKVGNTSIVLDHAMIPLGSTSDVTIRLV
jgi:hypothetical protein